MTKESGRKWDGKSRISNDNYRKRWNEIFNKPKNQKSCRRHLFTYHLPTRRQTPTNTKLQNQKAPLGVFCDGFIKDFTGKDLAW